MEKSAKNLNSLEKENNVIIIAIAGASGSGKTTISQKIAEQYSSENCTIISADRYYLDQSHLTEEEKKAVNFDHPKSIEFSLLAQNLADLKLGKTVIIPDHNFKTSSRVPGIEIKPVPIIIVEGILVLHAKELKTLIDINIFVQANSSLCLLRRINRDIKERGKLLENILQQYQNTVLPMYMEFIKPSKKTADLIIKNDLNNLNLEMQPVFEYLEKVRENLKLIRTTPHKISLFTKTSIMPAIVEKEDQTNKAYLSLQ